MKKVFLAFPPVFPLGYLDSIPPLSLGLITAFLKKEGCNVFQKDFNFDYIDFLLSSPNLKAIFKNISRQFAALNRKDRLSYLEQKQYLYLAEQALVLLPYLLKNSSRVQKCLRGEISDFPLRYEIFSKLSDLILYEGYGLISCQGLNKREVMRLVFKTGTLFSSYIKQVAIPVILKKDPGLIGMSLKSDAQLLPALSLAAMIKQYRPGLPIVLGGVYISTVIDKLIKIRALHKFVDGFIVGDGETALAQLVNSVYGDKRLDDIPNLFYFKGCKIQRPRVFHREDLNVLPTPDFKGLPLRRNFPFITSRGCFWAKCAFCYNVSYGNIRERSIQNVKRDIALLRKRHNIKHIRFYDTCFTPNRAREISKILKGQGITWQLSTRFSDGITLSLCKLLVKSGCIKLGLAIETVNPRLLRLTEKGTSKEQIIRVLRNCQDAHMPDVGINLMYGFPNQTRKEALEDYNFIIDLRKRFSKLPIQITLNQVLLIRKSKFYNDPDRYGIRIYGEGDFDSECEWNCPSWVEDERTVNHLHNLTLTPTEFSAAPPKINEKDFVNLIPSPNMLRFAVKIRYCLSETKNFFAKNKMAISAYARKKHISFKDALEAINSKLITAKPCTLPYLVIPADNFGYGKIVFADSEGEYLLRLCNGRLRVSEIVERFLKRYPSPQRKSRKFYIQLLLKVYQAGGLGLIKNSCAETCRC